MEFMCKLDSSLVLAFKLSYHAIQQMTTIINTRHALHSGYSETSVAGHAAVEIGRRRVWASRSMADNPPDTH
eukprot:986509-Pelagomonas_calceolata.AAC.2